MCFVVLKCNKVRADTHIHTHARTHARDLVCTYIKNGAQSASYNFILCFNNIGAMFFILAYSIKMRFGNVEPSSQYNKTILLLL